MLRYPLWIWSACSHLSEGWGGCIPALVAFAVFQNRTEKIVTSITEKSSELYHDFLFYIENDVKAEGADILPEANQVDSVSPNAN